MTDEDRYVRACKAMQSGVAAKMNYDEGETRPKHLRVGINSALVSTGALTKVLAEKGLITMEEYMKALADMMEKEVASYEKQLSEHHNAEITLG